MGEPRALPIAMRAAACVAASGASVWWAKRISVRTRPDPSAPAAAPAFASASEAMFASTSTRRPVAVSAGSCARVAAAAASELRDSASARIFSWCSGVGVEPQRAGAGVETDEGAVRDAVGLAAAGQHGDAARRGDDDAVAGGAAGRRHDTEGRRRIEAAAVAASSSSTTRMCGASEVACSFAPMSASSTCRSRLRMSWARSRRYGSVRASKSAATARTGPAPRRRRMCPERGVRRESFGKVGVAEQGLLGLEDPSWGRTVAAAG
jgi:hypothetical protein